MGNVSGLLGEDHQTLGVNRNGTSNRNRLVLRSIASEQILSRTPTCIGHLGSPLIAN
jgi:hypothetical protein